MRSSTVSLLALAIILAGCGDDDRAHEPPETAARVEPTAAAVDEPLSLAPSPDDACADDLARGTPEAIRATLGDLGYEGVYADACMAARAERTGDLAVCESLSVATLREHCRVRVAIAAAHPLDCPSAHTVDGRDPLCVALAARDRRLCAASGVVDRAVCETALGAEGRCRRLPDSARADCGTRATDLAVRVTGEVRTTPRLDTSAMLTTGTDAARSADFADRGARIEWRACARTLLVGDARAVTAPFADAALALEIDATGTPPFESSLGALRSADTRSVLAVSIGHARNAHAASGAVTITRLEAALGGVVVGSFHAVLSGTSQVVDGTFTTFVRDIDPRPSTCPSDLAPRQ